jgi:pyruvate/2-oxoglutarate dehydrogenase complex dihydrolipoamide dehydrogenase (E3) component
LSNAGQLPYRALVQRSDEIGAQLTKHWEYLMKRVVIVGGGHAGTLLARALDPIAEVVLIEPKAAFVHNVAAIRAVVDPAWLDKLILPFDHLLKRGRVLRDRVIAIEGDGVRLAANGSLEGDFVIVATGSRYAQPFKASGDSISDFRSALLEAVSKLIVRRAARRAKALPPSSRACRSLR